MEAAVDAVVVIDHHGRIQSALQRLEEGTFALCEKCGAEIDAERLLAVPYASLCRACARAS